MSSRCLTPDELYAEAFAHFQAGRLPPAIAFLEALAPDPRVGAEALNLLAVIVAQQGDLARAAELQRQLVAAHPLQPNYRENLVTTLERMGNLPAAIEAANDWAAALYLNKRWEEAATALRRVLRLAPDHWPARLNLAASCEALGRPEEALGIALSLLQCYAARDPVLVDLIAAVVQTLPELMDALAVAVAPPQPAADARAFEELLPKALCTVGNALSQQRHDKLAIRAYRHSLALAATPLAEWNLALALLVTGQFAAGWGAYEARWRWDEFDFPDRGFAQPRWQGEPLAGRAVLVYAEQGYGDTLQFCRFVPQLLQQTATVVFEVQVELFALMAHSLRQTGVRVVPRHEDPRQLAEPVAFETHCGLMSLPHLLGIDAPEKFASSPAYLEPSPAARTCWQDRLPASARRRIGLVWCGRPTHHKDADRSLHDPAAVLAPLFDMADSEWHSLQIGTGMAALAECVPQAVDHRHALANFDLTAALIERLDEIVAVDTAVAHLAGAMGKPCHLLLPYAADWRWLLQRTDSPWYPGVRLYRQSCRGDWSTPVAVLCHALARQPRQHTTADALVPASAPQPFDTGTLAWLKDEIDWSLVRAREALARHAAQPAIAVPLNEARNHLHKAADALTTAGLVGVAHFAATIVARLADLGFADSAHAIAVGTAVRAALADLRRYLDELMTEKIDQPLRLFPAYRELAIATGQPEPRPRDLFFPDLELRPPAHGTGVPLSALRLKALHMGFARGLIKWQAGDRAGFAKMRDAVAALAEGLDTAADDGLWWVALGWFDVHAARPAAVADALLLDDLIKLGEQLQKLAQGGSDSHPVQLLRGMLCDIALAAPGSAHLERLRATYRLAALVPRGVRFN